MGKLSTQEPYRGNDLVRTANGSGMHISDIGQASLLAHNSRTLHHLNVLRVPSATRSLLSIPQHTRDNNVFAEFHRFSFYIKDLDTRVVLLRGRLRHGLYALDVPPVPQVFSGVRLSSTHWHARLGHPATPIVRHGDVLHRQELPVVSNNNADSVLMPVSKARVINFRFQSRFV
jgi:hypothetical protein